MTVANAIERRVAESLVSLTLVPPIYPSEALQRPLWEGDSGSTVS